MITAWIGAICMAAIIPLQILLTLGFPLGEYSMGGRYKVFPPKMRVASGISAIILIFAVLLILHLGNIIHLRFNSELPKYIGYGFGAYFFLNIFTNLISKNKKEKYIMTPLAALVSFCFFYTTYHYL